MPVQSQTSGGRKEGRVPVYNARYLAGGRKEGRTDGRKEGRKEGRDGRKEGRKEEILEE
jgi:hypothetical protein